MSALQPGLAPDDHEETEEQGLFRDSVMRFVTERCDFDARRKLLESEAGFSDANWAHFAEQGWLAAAFSEEDGGFGGPQELAIVMEGVGRGLVLEPVMPNAALAGQVLARAGTPAQKEALLTPILEGAAKAAFGYVEPQSRFRVHDCATKAERKGDGWVLTGRKTTVFGAPSADHVIVTARVSGQRKDAEGLGLFVVAAGAPGVEIKAYPTVDGLRAGDVVLNGAEVSAGHVLGEPGEAGALIEDVVDFAAVMACAEAVGAMTAALDLTIAHLRERVQFGAPLISNQALQHRIVDLWIDINEARALTSDAVRMLSGGSTGGLRAAVSAAKALTSRAARHVGQEGVQLHGAMGVTDDSPVSHYFKRLTVLEMIFGNADHHEARYADALLRSN